MKFKVGQIVVVDLGSPSGKAKIVGEHYLISHIVVEMLEGCYKGRYATPHESNVKEYQEPLYIGVFVSRNHTGPGDPIRYSSTPLTQEAMDKTWNPKHFKIVSKYRFKEGHFDDVA